MSHADILDIDWGHIFRKHRHKNNKKFAVIYEKTVKKRPLPRYLPASCHGVRTLKVRFPTCVVRTRTYLTLKAITHGHIFDPEGFVCKPQIPSISMVQTERRVAARSLTLHDRPTCQGN